tara:strand:- start:619 stop:753 length:135 start_codon:yes stop_codon:yes gene_type:complete
MTTAVFILFGVVILQLCFVIFLLWVIGTRQYEINKEHLKDRFER